MIKKFGILFLSLMLVFGCSQIKTLAVGACDFVKPYLGQVNSVWSNIQKNYPTYLAIVQGLTNADQSVVVSAKAWIAAADGILDVLGSVIYSTCEKITEVDVQKAIQIGNETLPQVVVSEPKMKMLKIRK